MWKSSRCIKMALAVLTTLLLIANTCACSGGDTNREGTFLMEESVRTTSDPNLLVALLGDYKETDEATRGPFLVRKVTIDLSLGEVILGEPPGGVTVHQPLQSTTTTTTYTVDIDGGDENTAVLKGPDLMSPYTFSFPQQMSSREHRRDVFLYSDGLQRGYFFYNDCDFDPPPEMLQSNGELIPTLSNGGCAVRTEPVVEIFNLSDPTAVSSKTFRYQGRPGYFYGPPRNHWDQIRVVELRESGSDCFSSAYFYYNETAVRLVGYKLYERHSFHLNALAFGNQDNMAFAYNVVNIMDLGSPRPPGRTETPVGYKVTKLNIATGEVTSTILKNVPGLNPPQQPRSSSDASRYAESKEDATISVADEF